MAMWMIPVLSAVLIWIGTNRPPPAEERRIPEFNLPLYSPNTANPRLRGGIADERLHSSALAGKVVLLNFWASWCESCESEQIYLQQLFRDFGNKVVFLGIATSDSADAIFKSGKASRIPYRIVIDGDGELFKRTTAGAIPHTLVYSPQGKLIDEVYGALNPKEHDRIGQTLMNALNDLPGG